jgi:hypothetical protein
VNRVAGGHGAGALALRARLLAAGWRLDHGADPGMRPVGRAFARAGLARLSAPERSLLAGVNARAGLSGAGAVAALAQFCVARRLDPPACVELGPAPPAATLHLAAALRLNGGGRLVSTGYAFDSLTRREADLRALGLEGTVALYSGTIEERHAGVLAHSAPINLAIVAAADGVEAARRRLDLLHGAMAPGGVILVDGARGPARAPEPPPWLAADSVTLVRRPG